VRFLCVILGASHFLGFLSPRLVAAQQPSASFTVQHDADSFTGVSTTTIAVEGDDDQGSNASQAAEFMIVCSTKGSKHWVDFEIYTGGLSDSAMRYGTSGGAFESKCGNREPIPETWEALGSRNSAPWGSVVAYKHPPRRYTRYLMGCQPWSIRYYRANGVERTVRFDLSAMQTAMDKYSECKQ
jgi:hypothetical protein